MEPFAAKPTHESARTPGSLHPGRLAVYSALGASVGAVPLPWLPDTLVARVRGALVRDVVDRHGCRLPKAALALLVTPESAAHHDGVLRQAGRFVRTQILRRIGPVGFLPPLQFALQTFALGHLLDRYLGKLRAETAIVIDEAEAKSVRAAIDAAIARAVMTKGAGLDRPAFGESDDGAGEFLEVALRAVAAIPEWVESRLDTAFDAALKNAGVRVRG